MTLKGYCYQHIYHLTLVSITFRAHTPFLQTHFKETLFTAHQLYRWSYSKMTSASVTDLFLHTMILPPKHTHTRMQTWVPLQLNTPAVIFSSSSLSFSWTVRFSCSTLWHVPFFCFFCKFGCQCHSEEKKKKTNNEKHVSKLRRVGISLFFFFSFFLFGVGLINQECEVRCTSGGSSRNSAPIVLFMSVWC